jgi:hypothetical protein
MKTSSVIIVLLIVLFCGCGLLMNDHEWIEEKMYTTVAELPPDAGIGEPIVFNAKSYLANSCWKFSHLRTVSSGFDVYVTLYMKRSIEETICLEYITGVAKEGQFTPVFPGEYRFRFHFWRSDTSTLEHTVVVR